MCFYLDDIPKMQLIYFEVLEAWMGCDSLYCGLKKLVCLNIKGIEHRHEALKRN